MTNPHRVDMTGQRYGRLTVIKRAAGSRWVCRCDCGKRNVVERRDLVRNNTRSCGCLATEIRAAQFRKLLTKHGHAKGRPTPTYWSWQAMRARCLNPAASNYPKYGGAGVKICKRWNSFKHFLADMGTRPKGKTLDRYPNPNGDYKPSNCRWATPQQQRRNQKPAR
jgi:hypothetical protein